MLFFVVSEYFVEDTLIRTPPTLLTISLRLWTDDNFSANNVDGQKIVVNVGEIRNIFTKSSHSHLIYRNYTSCVNLVMKKTVVVNAVVLISTRLVLAL